MTNEEAVVILKNAIKKPNTEDGYLGQALTMAIKALEQLQEKPEYIDIWNVGAILRNVPEQPDICKIYGGACGYPIEACSECPKHEGWRPSKEQTSYKSDARRWKRRYLDLKQRIFKLEEQTRWIPVSERLPKENEYIGNVCKYYLIQDEYGDMHVAHLSNVGWIPMHSLKAIGDEIIAWRELPEPYKESDKNAKLD